MKHFILFLLVLTTMLSGCTISPPPDTEPHISSHTSSEPSVSEFTAETTTAPVSGWVTESGETFFVKADGSFHTGWLSLDNATYYLDENGILQTGWLELDGKRYYMQQDGAMSRGETIINGRSHFFASSGVEVIVANPWNSIRDEYEPDLVEAENGYLVDRSCLESLLQMLADCRKAGYNAQITSAYRDHETQIYLFNRKVNYYLDLGYTQDNARKEAATIIAIPGTSEHELGLAVDLVDNSYWGLDEAQEHTPAQQWLMEHCWQYGFILRYPNNKSSVTGIIYEPWHYRYVGIDVAKELLESGLCLEEYFNTLY